MSKEKPKNTASKKTTSLSLTSSLMLQVNEDGFIYFNEPSPMAWQKWIKAITEAESMDIEKIGADASVALFDRYFDKSENLTVTGPGGKEMHFNKASLQYLPANRKWAMLLTLFNSRPELKAVDSKNA